MCPGLAQNLKRTKGLLLPEEQPLSTVSKLTSFNASICRGYFPLQALHVLLQHLLVEISSLYNLSRLSRLIYSRDLAVIKKTEIDVPANPDIYSYFKVPFDLELQLTGAELSAAL